MIIFFIGPGGVGKSTCGKLLAQKLDFDFVDLDIEFLDIFGSIGEYINSESYESYYENNSKLFYELLSQKSSNTIFALSSGFLTYNPNLTQKHISTIKEKGISILLLPSKDIEESTEIIISRQMKRGFGLIESREKEKFQKRFEIYLQYGDIQIFSYETPNKIIEKIENLLIKYK